MHLPSSPAPASIVWQRHAVAFNESACRHCPVRGTSICAALSEDELLTLQAMSKTLSFRQRERIMEEDTPAHFVYNIIAGSVLLSKLLPDGRRQVVGIAIPGDFLGLSFSARHAFTATALGDVEVCRYPRLGFETFVDRSKALLKRLHSTTGHELGLAQEHMMLLGRRSAEEKLACFLVTLRDRWAQIHGPRLRIDLPMTRQDIADYLGLTVETVSRNLTKLARHKLIAIIPDGVRILDPAGLTRVAGC